MKFDNLNNLFIEGGFRDIDVAFANMLSRLAADDPPGVRFAALLASRSAGDGHVCVDLHRWAGLEIHLSNGQPSGQYLPGFDDWLDQLNSSPVVAGNEGNRPLVCDPKGRVYLQRLYQHEQRLAVSLGARATAIDSAFLLAHQNKLGDLLDRYFIDPALGASVNWQKVAAVVALAKKLCIISGGPGTGKTTTIAKILGVLLEFRPDHHRRIHLCAPTGKAAAHLGEALTQVCRSFPFPKAVRTQLTMLDPCTIHRLIKLRPRGRGCGYNEDNPLPTDVVVVDEASMVDLVLMSRLVRAVPPHARLIVLGDKDQLASVDAGAVFGDMCQAASAGRYSKQMADLIVSLVGMDPEAIDTERSPGSEIIDCAVVLKHNYRFEAQKGIGALTQAINDGDQAQVKRELKRGIKDSLYWEQFSSRLQFNKLLAAYALRGYEFYLASDDPGEALSRFNHFMILSALASGPTGVDQINHFVHALLSKNHLIAHDLTWYRGRPVMVTRNDYRIGLFNGDTGLTWPDASGRLRVWFQSESGELRALSPQRLPEHQTVFAMTVHKSQGSEFDQVLLILPNQETSVISRELLYTGCSRGRESVILMANDSAIDLAIARKMGRVSGLSEALQQRR